MHELAYRVRPFSAFPLAADSVIAYFPSVNRSIVLPRQDLERLAMCTELSSLSMHAGNIVRRVSPSSDLGETRAWLECLAEGGALLSYSDLLSRSTSAAAPARAPVEWLVIPTRSRPERLLSAARSYLGNVRAYGRRLRLFVSDQTPGADGQATCTRAELAALAGETGCEVFYAGLQQKETLAEVLCSGGSIPPDTVRFALFGRADAGANIGANRNAALLQTLGSVVVSVDDDTACETVRAPGSGSEIRFAGEGDSTEAWFASDWSGAGEFAETAEIDFIGEHERLLGRGVGELFGQAAESGGVKVGTACRHMLEYLCSGGGKVVLTYSGLAGDAGIYSAFPFLIHPSADTRNRLRASPEAYARNVESRDVVRQALCATVTHGLGGGGLAACMGLDNREILPPFFPPFRSEDGIFAQMLGRGREGCCFAHAPFTVRHERPQRRVYGDVLTVRMSDLVMSALGSCPASVAETPEEHLVRTGKFLSFLGTRSESEFREWVQSAMLARASGIVQAAAAALNRDGGRPDYWARDVAGIIERVRCAVEDADYIVPEEVRAIGGLQTAKEIVRQFGELTCWWPAIVEKTTTLAESGVQVGVRLG